MVSRVVALVSVAVAVVGLASHVQAQDRTRPIVEAVVGTSGFIDESWDHFPTTGVSARWFVTPRFAIGPEITIQRGRNEASNLTVTGNVSFDLIQEGPGRRIVPYVVAGGGYLRQRTLVGSGPGSNTLQPFVSAEGTLSGGFGARIAAGPSFFVAPEFRLGWEPEMRFAMMIGVRP